MADRDDVNVLRLNVLAADPTDTAKLAGGSANWPSPPAISKNSMQF
jgi:hypothetical protein